MQDNICKLLAHPNDDGTPNIIKMRIVEPSRHRAINILDFDNGFWQLPSDHIANFRTGNITDFKLNDEVNINLNPSPN